MRTINFYDIENTNEANIFEEMVYTISDILNIKADLIERSIDKCDYEIDNTTIKDSIKSYLENVFVDNNIDKDELKITDGIFEFSLVDEVSKYETNDDNLRNNLEVAANVYRNMIQTYDAETILKHQFIDNYDNSKKYSILDLFLNVDRVRDESVLSVLDR